jgi:hypothetical protein
MSPGMASAPAEGAPRGTSSLFFMDWDGGTVWSRLFYSGDPSIPLPSRHVSRRRHTRARRVRRRQYLAIVDGGPCYVVHPSDPAVALTALDGIIEVASARGVRSIPIGEFYTLPTDRLDQETILATGLIAARLRGVIGELA